LSAAIRRVVFVCRSATGESLRSLEALRQLDRVLVEVVEVGDVRNTDELIRAVRALIDKHGPIEHVVTAQETLLEPVALTREALKIAGMSSETVRRTLDKSLLKSTLRAAGVQTPFDRIVTRRADAVRFLSEVGFPIMLKPLSGSGALATLLIRSAAELDQALALMQPSRDWPALAESYLHGQELCFDTITIDNEPQLYSICRYYPSILEALEDPQQQWTCIMPREIDTDFYGDFIEQGLAAARALSVGNSFTHMEGFLDSEGRLLGFTDATLRPAGARIGPMLGFAYDVDPYRAWARVAIDGAFDGPWDRQYAVGTIFLRGSGCAVIERVDGADQTTRELGQLIVDVHWPQAGARKSDTYTGDGYVTVRHGNTSEVDAALRFIKDTLRISYSEPESSLQWRDRFQNYHQLNRPAWEVGPQ
jgi:biotin carboxylase